MEYYCVMVKTGEELSFKNKVEELLKENFFDAKFYFFQRTLKTNKGIPYEKPLFPGYLFLQLEKLTVEFILILRKVKGFVKILMDTSSPIQIVGNQLEELRLFIGNGEHWGISKLEFVPGQNVRVVSGPLMGMEGKIYKINKKRGRVTIFTSIYPDGGKIDLAFENVVPFSSQENSENKN